MSESSYLDRPQDDETSKAHPAYKRGKGRGISAVIEIVNNILDEVDIGHGHVNSPPIEDMRQRVLALKKSKDGEVVYRDVEVEKIVNHAETVVGEDPKKQKAYKILEKGMKDIASKSKGNYIVKKAQKFLDEVNSVLD